MLNLPNYLDEIIIFDWLRMGVIRSLVQRVR